MKKNQSGTLKSDGVGSFEEVNHVGFVLHRYRDRFLRLDVGFYQGVGAPLGVGEPVVRRPRSGVPQQSGMNGCECKPDVKRKRDSAQPQERAQPSIDGGRPTLRKE